MLQRSLGKQGEAEPSRFVAGRMLPLQAHFPFWLWCLPRFISAVDFAQRQPESSSPRHHGPSELQDAIGPHIGDGRLTGGLRRGGE
jgi:hypothetical protein